MKDYEYIVYKQMCCGCSHEKRCHDDCEYCDDYLERLENYQATKHKKYKHLTMEQKFSIYHEMKYGRYTQKEIANILKISRSYVSRIEKKALEKLASAISIQDEKI